MPRPLRTESSLGLHHVTNRSLTLVPLFRDDDDRATFLRILAHWAQRLDVLIHAWMLLETHHHQVLHAKAGVLSKLMQLVESAYGREYNDRWGRRGHLVQDRFRSNSIENEAQFAGWVAYTHANAIDARLATLDTLVDYPWCSFGALLGMRPPLRVASPEQTLRLFSPSIESARDMLRTGARVAAADMKARRDARDERVIAVVGTVARANGVDVEAVLAGSQHPRAVRARREAIRQSLAMGMTDRAVAKSMQVALVTIRRVRRACSIGRAPRHVPEGRTVSDT